MTERDIYLNRDAFPKQIIQFGSFTISYLFKQLKVNSSFQELFSSTGTMLHKTILTESYRFSLKEFKWKTLYVNYSIQRC